MNFESFWSPLNAQYNNSTKWLATSCMPMCSAKVDMCAHRIFSSTHQRPVHRPERRYQLLAHEACPCFPAKWCPGVHRQASSQIRFSSYLLPPIVTLCPGQLLIKTCLNMSYHISSLFLMTFELCF